MNRVLPTLLFLVLPLTALADGKVFPPIALPANITIPDQRALIHFTNGTERLVIETRFTGSGTNFAWVVPLPSQPVIEEATTGLFPTLQYLFRPQIRHSIPQYYPAMLAAAWLFYLLLFVRPTGRLTWLDIAACLLVGISVGVILPERESERSFYGMAVIGLLVFLDLLFISALVRHWKRPPDALGAAMLTAFLALQVLPFVLTGSLEPLNDGKVIWALLFYVDLFYIVALVKWWQKYPQSFGVAFLSSLVALQVVPLILASGVRSMSRAEGPSGSLSGSVSILERKLVGIFETTTISSRDPKALPTWLHENGFAVSTNSEPVIESYVKDGWVFVATKVRRDKPEHETSTPHPLSFTFKTDKPVYPMRLTGVDNGPLRVELYVFGSMRAKAQHFKVERCTRPAYPKVPEYWSYRSPERPNIVHPLLRKWTEGAPVVTKLIGTLSSANMQKDVWFEWAPFSEKRSRIFSYAGGLTYAVNWGTGILVAGLAGACVLAWQNQTRRRQLPKVASGLTAFCIVLAGVIYLALPKTQVRLVSFRELRSDPEDILRHLSWELEAETPSTANWTGDEARQQASNIVRITNTNAPYWTEWARPNKWKGWQNFLLDGPLREEDSPGNYLLRETQDRIEFVGYDAEGAEHVLRSWSLRSKP